MSDKVTKLRTPHYSQRMTREEWEAWKTHPVTLPDGTVKQYQHLNYAEHRWLTYSSIAQASAAKAEVDALMEVAALRALNGEAEFTEWLDTEEAEDDEPPAEG